MITIWSSVHPNKVLDKLSPVLKNNLDVQIKITKDYVVPEGTKIILALGAGPLAHLQTLKLVHKGRTITSTRTIPLYLQGVPILVSYSADIGEIDYRYHVDLLTDLVLAIRFCKLGSFKPVMGKYAWVTDFYTLIERIKSQYEHTKIPVEVMLDLETVGLDPYRLPTKDHPGAYIVTIQVAFKLGEADVIKFGSMSEEVKWLRSSYYHAQIEWLLTSPLVSLRGANLKFDLHWLWVRGKFECTNFKFDTTIVGSLLDENRSNSLTTHVKIYAPRLAGYCVVPETRILTSDLRWVEAKTLNLGDEIVGFEETAPFKHRRRIKPSKIVGLTTLLKRCYRIRMLSGRQITVSDNHQFLKIRPKLGGMVTWINTEDIKVGMHLKTFPMEEEEKSFDAGWMSGIMDGEGWACKSKNKTGFYFRAGWAQKHGLVLSKSIDLVKKWGFKYWTGDKPKNGVPHIQFYSWDSFSILQKLRPIRLISKRNWEDTPLPTRNGGDLEEDVVIEKELVGVKEVLGVETTTHTFIAEGICSHNSDKYDSTVDKSRMDLALQNDPTGFLDYSAGDVDGGLEVAQAQKKALLEDPKLTRFYVTILHPAARAFEQIEQGGVFLDMNAYQELKSDLELEQHRLIKKAGEIVGGRIVAKHSDNSRMGGINLTKASLIKDYMFSPMGLNLKPLQYTPKLDKDDNKVPSTAMEHLEMFSTHPQAKDFVQLIAEYGSVTKTYSTYVLGFMEHIRSDGRFHPTYFLFVGNRDDGDGGASTGRLSCHGPAFQVIPKRTKWAKRIRRCFPAPPGYVVSEADYAQGELKVIADIANCKAMLTTYNQGKDLHVKTAAFAAKMLYEELLALEKTNLELFELIRQKGKAGNFGLVFGMQPPGFVVYAFKNYKAVFSIEEATAFRNEYFREYYELLEYHKESIFLARRDTGVRSPLGRLRHLPLIHSKAQGVSSQAERQAINSRVQSTLTDMLLWCIALQWSSGVSKEAPSFGAVHDAAYNYIPEDKVDIILPRMLEIQENLPFEQVGWAPKLKFTADAKIGKNMADLTKYKVKH